MLSRVFYDAPRPPRSGASRRAARSCVSARSPRSSARAYGLGFLTADAAHHRAHPWRVAASISRRRHQSFQREYGRRFCEGRSFREQRVPARAYRARRVRCWLRPSPRYLPADVRWWHRPWVASSLAGFTRNGRYGHAVAPRQPLPGGVGYAPGSRFLRRGGGAGAVRLASVCIPRISWWKPRGVGACCALMSRAGRRCWRDGVALIARLDGWSARVAGRIALLTPPRRAAATSPEAEMLDP
jgi:hypothetical protein